MTLESQLLEAVRLGKQEEARELIGRGADLRHDDDAALRLAAIHGDDSMRNLLMWYYPDQAALEEVADRIAEDLIRRATALRRRPKEIIAARFLKKSSPPVEL